MDYKLEELLQKEKAELDKMKVALEICQSEDRLAFEKRRYRTENLRFFGIAVLTSVISLGSAYFIESFKQGHAAIADVKKEFSDLHKSYLLEKEEAKKSELACALAHFDPAISSDVIRYKLICEASSNVQAQANMIANVDTTSVQVKSAVQKLDNYEKRLLDLNREKLAASPTEYIHLNKQIADVKSNIDKVVNEVPEIRSAAASSQSIEKNIQQIQSADESIQQTKDIGSGTGTKSNVTWFKEGYFLEFGNYRVLLQYLDKKLGIQVSVCKPDDKGACGSTLYTKQWIKFDAPFQFSDAGKSYRINLEAIDHAGNNPFTLAAYITFESLDAK
ncbi:MAG: hypothetical protein JWO09_608 [Bacteroidetes bacterium]|nr:hypothetical protein [Bacteroidota bacterium]